MRPKKFPELRLLEAIYNVEIVQRECVGGPAGGKRVWIRKDKEAPAIEGGAYVLNHETGKLECVF